MSDIVGVNTLVIRICIIAALAGLLFGLDVAYVNGSLPFIVSEFHLTEKQSQQIAGVLLTGAAFGALCSGWVSHRFGRKKVLVLSAIIFTAFTLLGIMSQTIDMLLITRFVIGIAVGISSFVAPLYLSEIAPCKIRGGIIAMYQLMITLGILLMFLSNTALTYTGSWRLMMAVLLIPLVVMLVGTLTIPESPRWLVLVGREKEAEQVLSSIRTCKNEISIEMMEIKKSLVDTHGGFKLLLQPFFLKVVALSIALQCLQQFSGINAFMYYSRQIFATAGFSNPSAATIIIIGLVNVLSTFIAIKYVDRYGRKPILYFGLSLLIISCTIVGCILKHDSSNAALTTLSQYSLLCFCVLFIFAFAISLGPIIWILCSEIFPLEGRDLGITISTMTNWIGNAIVGSYTLTWFTYIGVSGTFWFFGSVCILGFILVNRVTPETRNVPLETLGANLKSNKKLRDMGHELHH